MKSAARIGGVVAAAVVLAGLTACEPSQFGTAALIDGDRLTVAQLEQQVKRLHERQGELGIQPADPAQASQYVVQVALLDAIKERAATEAGITVTDGQVAKALDELRAEIGGEDALAQWSATQQPALTLGGVEEWLRIELLMEKLGEKLVPGRQTPEVLEKRGMALAELWRKTAASMDFEVNPRYGTFDPSTGEMAATSYDFLVEKPSQGAQG